VKKTLTDKKRNGHNAKSTVHLTTWTETSDRINKDTVSYSDVDQTTVDYRFEIYCRIFGIREQKSNKSRRRKSQLMFRRTPVDVQIRVYYQKLLIGTIRGLTFIVSQRITPIKNTERKLHRHIKFL